MPTISPYANKTTKGFCQKSNQLFNAFIIIIYLLQKHQLKKTPLLSRAQQPYRYLQTKKNEKLLKITLFRSNLESKTININKTSLKQIPQIQNYNLTKKLESKYYTIYSTKILQQQKKYNPRSLNFHNCYFEIQTHYKLLSCFDVSILRSHKHYSTFSLHQFLVKIPTPETHDLFTLKSSSTFLNHNLQVQSAKRLKPNKN
eukprot:TRINITY_DN7016_c0_g1_i1.p1 TRINITY_DN7016_c0_g1~~TRINITY_DN7016_c0_g1_i1.p1  ORF type:complete len:201 (+),score=-20.45 TRINITY_DN7016_c0_g1_i1:275-877(+)